QLQNEGRGALQVPPHPLTPAPNPTRREGEQGAVRRSEGSGVVVPPAEQASPLRDEVGWLFAAVRWFMTALCCFFAQNNAICRRWRHSSIRKNGPPASAVRMPTCNCSGARRERASPSA